MKSCIPEYPCEICYNNEHELEIKITAIYNGHNVLLPTYMCEDCLANYKQNADGSYTLVLTTSKLML